MKKPLLLAFGIAIAFIGVALAQTNISAALSDPGAIAAGADTSGAVAASLIQSFANTHPWVATFLAVMAVARAIAKPLFSLFESSLGADNAIAKKLAAAESGSIYKGISWALDFLLSVKLHLIAPPAKSSNDKPTV